MEGEERLSSKNNACNNKQQNANQVAVYCDAREREETLCTHPEIKEALAVNRDQDQEQEENEYVVEQTVTVVNGEQSLNQVSGLVQDLNGNIPFAPIFNPLSILAQQENTQNATLFAPLTAQTQSNQEKAPQKSKYGVLAITDHQLIHPINTSSQPDHTLPTTNKNFIKSHTNTNQQMGGLSSANLNSQRTLSKVQSSQVSRKSQQLRANQLGTRIVFDSSKGLKKGHAFKNAQQMQRKLTQKQRLHSDNNDDRKNQVTSSQVDTSSNIVQNRQSVSHDQKSSQNRKESRHLVCKVQDAVQVPNANVFGRGKVSGDSSATNFDLNHLPPFGQLSLHQHQQQQQLQEQVQAAQEVALLENKMVEVSGRKGAQKEGEKNQMQMQMSHSRVQSSQSGLHSPATASNSKSALHILSHVTSNAVQLHSHKEGVSSQENTNTNTQQLIKTANITDIQIFNNQQQWDSQPQIAMLHLHSPTYKSANQTTAIASSHDQKRGREQPVLKNLGHNPFEKNQIQNTFKVHTDRGRVLTAAEGTQRQQKIDRMTLLRGGLVSQTLGQAALREGNSKNRNHNSNLLKSHPNRQTNPSHKIHKKSLTLRPTSARKDFHKTKKQGQGVLKKARKFAQDLQRQREKSVQSVDELVELGEKGGNTHQLLLVNKEEENIVLQIKESPLKDRLSSTYRRIESAKTNQSFTPTQPNVHNQYARMKVKQINSQVGANENAQIRRRPHTRGVLRRVGQREHTLSEEGTEGVESGQLLSGQVMGGHKNEHEHEQDQSNYKLNWGEEEKEREGQMASTALGSNPHLKLAFPDTTIENNYSQQQQLPVKLTQQTRKQNSLNQRLGVRSSKRLNLSATNDEQSQSNQNGAAQYENSYNFSENRRGTLAKNLKQLSTKENNRVSSNNADTCHSASRQGQKRTKSSLVSGEQQSSQRGQSAETTSLYASSNLKFTPGFPKRDFYINLVKRKQQLRRGQSVNQTRLRQRSSEGASHKLNTSDKRSGDKSHKQNANRTTIEVKRPQTTSHNLPNSPFGCRSNGTYQERVNTQERKHRAEKPLAIADKEGVLPAKGEVRTIFKFTALQENEPVLAQQMHSARTDSVSPASANSQQTNKSDMTPKLGGGVKGKSKAKDHHSFTLNTNKVNLLTTLPSPNKIQSPPDTKTKDGLDYLKNMYEQRLKDLNQLSNQNKANKEIKSALNEISSKQNSSNQILSKKVLSATEYTRLVREKKSDQVDEFEVNSVAQLLGIEGVKSDKNVLQFGKEDLGFKSIKVHMLNQAKQGWNQTIETAEQDIHPSEMSNRKKVERHWLNSVKRHSESLVEPKTQNLTYKQVEVKVMDRDQVSYMVDVLQKIENTKGLEPEKVKKQVYDPMGNVVDVKQNKMAIRAYQSKVASQLRVGVQLPMQEQNGRKHQSEIGLLTESKPFDMMDVLVSQMKKQNADQAKDNLDRCRNQAYCFRNQFSIKDLQQTVKGNIGDLRKRIINPDHAFRRNNAASFATISNLKRPTPNHMRVQSAFTAQLKSSLNFNENRNQTPKNAYRGQLENQNRWLTKQDNGNGFVKNAPQIQESALSTAKNSTNALANGDKYEDEWPKLSLKEYRRTKSRQMQKMLQTLDPVLNLPCADHAINRNVQLMSSSAGMQTAGRLSQQKALQQTQTVQNSQGTQAVALKNILGVTLNGQRQAKKGLKREPMNYMKHQSATTKNRQRGASDYFDDEVNRAVQPDQTCTHPIPDFQQDTQSLIN